MQSFSDLFANNRLLAIGVVLAAIAVILAVGIALFRLVFGRRLHMAGGRTRQPRLGVVDAFDLDRQRQLVLIRRDNVEHLLMIGGPNDVLIEAAIVRASAPVAGRDKEPSFTPSVGIPAPMPQQPPAPAALPAAASAPAGGPEGGSNVPFPVALAPEPRVAVVPEPVRPTPAVEPAPVAVTMPTPNPVAQPEPRMPGAAALPPAGNRPQSMTPRPGAGLPPRPPVTPVPRPAATPTPRANLSRATPLSTPGEPRTPSPRVEPPVGRLESETPAGSDRPVPETPREPASSMRFPPPRTLRSDGPTSNNVVPPTPPAQSDEATPPPRPAPPTRVAPAGPVRTLPPRPTPGAPPAQAVPPAQAPARNPMPSLGSLEEEMAKLLGRPMPPPDAGN